MPANGPLIRGRPGPHIIRVGSFFNPETGVITQEITYAGSQLGVAGLANSFKNSNREFRLGFEDGLSTITVYLQSQGSDVLDKYEIVWEMEQRPIWANPAVREAAIAYDSLVDGVPANYTDTFQKLAENAKDGPMSSLASGDPVSGAMFQRVVAHLRQNADGWEQEYVILRRTRTVPPNLASPCNIKAASLIYTTDQLQLPDDVVFQIPSDADIAGFENPDPDNFQWGWRRRPSTVVIQGQSSEQTSEFILSAWSTLNYSVSTGNADW